MNNIPLHAWLTLCASIHPSIDGHWIDGHLASFHDLVFTLWDLNKQNCGSGANSVLNFKEFPHQLLQ